MNLDLLTTTPDNEATPSVKRSSQQKGYTRHLHMIGEVVGTISGELTVAPTVVRMVHGMVHDAVSDVIGRLVSKIAIGVLTAGLAIPWAVSTVITGVSSWMIRLSKEVADAVLSAKNLKNLLTEANRLFDDVAAAFTHIPAKVSGVVTTEMETVKGLAASLSNPQYTLAGLPSISIHQAGDVGRTKPTVHRPTGGPKLPETPRPNSSGDRWGRKLDDAPARSDLKSTTGGDEGTPLKGGGDGKGGDGNDPMSGPIVLYLPRNATAAELKEFDDYVAGCNRVPEAGTPSKTGGVATTKSFLAQEAEAAVARKKKAYPELYSGGKVADHAPDTGWGRGPELHE